MLVEPSVASKPHGVSLRNILLAGFHNSPDALAEDGSRTVVVHNIPLVVKVKQNGTKTAVLLPDDHASISKLEAALTAEQALLVNTAKAAKITVAELVAKGPKSLGNKSTEQGRTL